MGEGGFERQAFADWLQAQPGYGGAEVVEVERAVGGVSNDTWRVTLRGAPISAVALRIEPADGIFAPYDVVREARVVEALRASPVPVPAVVGVDASGEVLGRRFAAFEWIDAPHMGEAGPDADFGAFVRAVAVIHQLDGVEPDLGFLGRPGTAAEGVARELDDIAARAERFAARDPRVGAALDVLRAAAPGDGQVRLCQGDINVFNYLFRAGEVVGVVDWERARLSDPRSDAGHLLALSHLKGAPWGPADEMPFAQAYGEAADAPVRGLAFFRARWLIDLLVIAHTVDALGLGPIWFSTDDAGALLDRALAELS